MRHLKLLLVSLIALIGLAAPVPAAEAAASRCPFPVIIWDGPNMTGHSISFYTSGQIINLTDYGWNDRARSWFVSRYCQVDFYSDVMAGGHLLRPGVKEVTSYPPVMSSIYIWRPW